MTSPLLKEIIKTARADTAKRLGIHPSNSLFDFFDLGVEIGFELGVELAKPIVDPFRVHTHVGYAWTYAGAQGSQKFKDKESAVAHALAHGYREGKQ